MADVEGFIRRWQGQEGGQERANYAMFLAELCDVLNLPRPNPASAAADHNDYVFERVVRETSRDGSISNKRIDLYKRDCFILEAKQSRLEGDKAVVDTKAAPSLPGIPAPTPRGRRGAGRAWDVLMINARRQAEDYVRLLPPSHEPPPFVLVCDVGHCIEVYANFRRDGKAYDQFPDRRSFRIYLEELRDPAIRERLAAIWTDPMALDPSTRSAKVTRDIATRLAKVSKALEAAGHPAERVAMFLMRVLFTMFAEDVELLPKDSFKNLLSDCVKKPAIFPGMLEELWSAMDTGGFSATIRDKVRQFNGEFFKKREALPLPQEEIGELLEAARYDWRDVEPAIFGTLLEQALDPDERRRLGAHYTPRAYVERLVIATIIDPLREEWTRVLSTAERQKADGRNDAAADTVKRFHDKLCDTTVLDPACGTGNFLYVSLELMKRLEGEVLEAIADLGGQDVLSGLSSHTIDPHQFLGLEINRRAVAIAELVLWIGHLQWHVRTKGQLPSDPILRAFRNIKSMDAVLTWDGYPEAKFENGVESYPNPRVPEWPKADFIVGNPPFVGGKDIRARMGDAYTEALWAAHKHMNESADFVMYWWDRAADILLKKGTRLRRFGFVTTNSISQVFQRRVMEHYLSAKRPLSLVMAVPDHPWTKVSRDNAAVRIAMTVAEAGKRDGLLRDVISEAAVDTDAPIIGFREATGRINSDLTVGVDVASAQALRAAYGICSRGVVLHGSGFLVTPKEAEQLGLGRLPGLNNHIRQFANGRDLTSRSRGLFVLDLYGLTEEEVRVRYPAVYQYIKINVKEITRTKPDGTIEYIGRDWNNRSYRKENWWLFGENVPDLRAALHDTQRYIATVETAKHRVFQFLDASILPDNKLVAIGLSDGFGHGVLSSRAHVTWSLRAGGWLGVGNDPVYVKSRCFDPFPFPDATDAQKDEIGAIAEELDALRKTVLAAHEHLTLTGLYNVLEELRAGKRPDDLDPRSRRTFDDGLVLVLKELHDRLDAAVAAAYGWPADLDDEEILARLVALNRERAREEKRGLVRWLRPDYQIPRFGSDREKAKQLEADLAGSADDHSAVTKVAFPKTELEQTAVVMAALVDADGPVDVAAISSAFKYAKGVKPAISDILMALNRMGLISTSDSGKTFALRRAA